MQLHEIKKNESNKKKKRIGRGGKKGTYSGKGMKGQKSRAGGTPRPALRDIVKKFPKRRGYRFSSVQEKPVVLSLELIDKHFSKNEVVSPITLNKKGLIGKNDKKVKILGDGDVEFALTFEGYITFSSQAREKIEKAGGKIDTKAKFRSTLPKAERPKRVKKVVIEKPSEDKKQEVKKEVKKIKKSTEKTGNQPKADQPLAGKVAQKKETKIEDNKATEKKEK